MAFVGIVGAGIEVSRGYLGANELQKATDAAALYGAMQLQTRPTTNPADSVVRYIARDSALRDSIVIPASNVEYGRWNPADGTFDSTATLASSNAVRVTAAVSVKRVASNLLRAVRVAPRRRSVAWVASVQNASCPAPWGLPLAALNEQLYGFTDYTLRADMFARLRDSLARTNGAFRVAILLVPRQMAPVTNAWPFEGVDDISPGGGMNAYADQVAMASCTAQSSIRISNTENFPSSGVGSVPKKTADGAYGGGPAGSSSMCDPIPKNSNSADCYPVGSGRTGTSGVSRAVSWTSLPVSNSATVLSIGGFRVMCVFVGKGNSADPDERCAWLESYISSGFAPAGTQHSYPPGTLLGYPEAKGPDLGNGTILGNTKSLYQRLILVK